MLHMLQTLKRTIIPAVRFLHASHTLCGLYNTIPFSHCAVRFLYDTIRFAHGTVRYDTLLVRYDTFSIHVPYGSYGFCTIWIYFLTIENKFYFFNILFTLISKDWITIITSLNKYIVKVNLRFGIIEKYPLDNVAFCGNRLITPSVNDMYL